MSVGAPDGRRAGVGAPTHPLATTALVLSCLGFAIPVVSGLVGALLAVAALQAIAREPDRWGGTQRARTAVAIGLLTGVVPLAVIALVQRDSWGVAPLVLLLAYGAVLAGLAVSARPGARPSAGRVIGGATLGAGGIGAMALLLIGMVLAIVFLFQTMISGIADAVGDAACGGS